MPALSVLITANASQYSCEVARAEAIAFGFAKSAPKALENGFATSFARIRKQMDLMAGFKTAVDAARGGGMMSEAEVAASEERTRLAQVEEATRSNMARRLWRQRKEDAAAMAEQAAHGSALNVVMRESLVIMREILRGNWSRVAGSATILAQGLRRMRNELGILGTAFTLTGAIVIGSVATIVGAFFIWHNRVKALTADLINLSRVDMPRPDLTRLTAYEEGWRRIRNMIAEASDEINSANYHFEQNIALLNQAQATEKSLLELRKQKELDAVEKDPAAKAAIRAKYLKEEHDLEVAQQKEQRDADAKHIADLQREQDEKTASASAIKVRTEEEDNDLAETYKKQVEANNKREKDKHGEDIVGTSPLEKAQALVEELTEKSKRHRFMSTGPGSPAIDMGEQGLGEDDSARLAAAQGRIDQGRKDQATADEFARTKKDRDDARTEQKRLYEEAAKAGADKIKAAAALNAAKLLDARILADDDKLRAAQDDEKDTKDDQKNGHGGYALNSNQRLGAYASTPPDFKKLVEAAVETAKNTRPKGASSPTGPRHTQFGPHSRP